MRLWSESERKDVKCKVYRDRSLSSENDISDKDAERKHCRDIDVEHERFEHARVIPVPVPTPTPTSGAPPKTLSGITRG